MLSEVYSTTILLFLIRSELKFSFGKFLPGFPGSISLLGGFRVNSPPKCCGNCPCARLTTKHHPEYFYIGGSRTYRCKTPGWWGLMRLPIKKGLWRLFREWERKLGKITVVKNGSRWRNVRGSRPSPTARCTNTLHPVVVSYVMLG